MADVVEAVTRAHATEWARVVATLIRVTGDWELAQDCAQDAFTRALDRWPREGVPAKPGAWLTTVARNRALDLLRRASTERSALRQVAVLADPPDASEVGGVAVDDRLRLVFTCCHPALSLEAQVALTLRTVAGLEVADIARALMATEATMAKRLVRARAKIRHAGLPYRVPDAAALPARLNGVLGVLYLLFNQGYSASADQAAQGRLAQEAIRLTRLLVELLPGEPEPVGLLALMLCQNARAESRVDAAGELVTLEHQDRALWDAAEIAEAVALLGRLATRPGERGAYELQGRIAATHASAPTHADTDVATLLSLYDELVELAPTPVIKLNRAVAVAMAMGPDAGLAELDRLPDAGLGRYHLWPAARADLLRRLGRSGDAVAFYRQARELAPSEIERRYLDRRIAECLTAERRVGHSGGVSGV